MFRNNSLIYNRMSFYTNSILLTFEKLKYLNMITESMIKDEFIHQTISSGMQKINQVQQEVVNNYFSDTGTLHRYLVNKPFGIDRRGTYFMRQLAYMRFLDIGTRKRRYKYHDNIRSGLSLYNRVVWGVMYGEVMPELRYGLTQEIKKQIHDQLLQNNQNSSIE